MSEDKFDPTPGLKLDTDKLLLSGIAGETFEGSFVVRSDSDLPIRGMVYSTNPYITVTKPRFEGEQSRITFAATHNGFSHGDVITGSFYIIANGINRELPYEITFNQKAPTVEGVTIKSLTDFADLAREHWQAALRFFSSDAFYDVIENAPVHTRLLYRGYRSVGITSFSMEEFLVAGGLKKKLAFSVECDDELSFYNVDENQKHVIHIKKNSWGYIRIEATCDEDFISVEREDLGSEYFIGSELELSFYIHKDMLHAGKNFGVINIRGAGITKEIRVMVSMGSEEKSEKHKAVMEEKAKRARLSQLYIDYRLKAITSGDFCNSSIEILDSLIETYPDEAMYKLQKTQCLIVNKNRQEALWLITDLKREIEDKKSTEWAYLLYLCTLLEQEDTYVDKLTAEIEGILLVHPEDVRIFWFLLFLRTEYITDSKRKLNDIKTWVEAGFESPYLLIEAYRIYLSDPYLLNDFSHFSLQVLIWAARHGQISVNLAEQFQDLLPDQKKFDEKVYRLARYIYDRYPQKDLLFAIVSYLLKCNMAGQEYLFFYRMAIDKEIKLTGLYEAFIMSLPEDYVERLPELVTMYFRYDNNLSYDKKAFVYANVITYKKDDPKLYDQYAKTIQRFSLEHMGKGDIDDNLGLCYADVLESGVIDHDIAVDMDTLIFSNKIITLHDNINNVVVFEDALSRPHRAPVHDFGAFVPIFTADYQVFLETADGQLISDPGAYNVQPLFNTEKYLDRLIALSNETLPYFLHRQSRHRSPDEFTITELDRIGDFLDSDSISAEYKLRRLPFMSSALKLHDREEVMIDYLIKSGEYKKLDTETAAHVMDLLIISDRYDQAYDLLLDHHGITASSKSLLRLITDRCKRMGEQTDDFLISMCAYLMQQYLFSEATLSYLNSFYVGPTHLMESVWKFAYANELPTGLIEERILTQMLYTEDMDETSGEIFASYMKKRVSPIIVEAYLTFWSRISITTEKKVPQEVFEHLLPMYSRADRLNDSERLALLKHLCREKELSEQKELTLEKLLREYMVKNIYFAFYRDADRRFIVRFHLYDKRFVEYHGRPGMNIYISYRDADGNAHEERMQEMYDGIYVRQFVMFFGESIRYRIFDDASRTNKLTEGELSLSDNIDQGEPGRYGLLNRMKSDILYRNERELLDDMTEYKRLEFLSKQIFYPMTRM
ncbi:MAG: DUF5717 family protein [Lachnospiraceae bacterium]|nr:DUF5717 family protein [Lachnospiraceae bacterium]